MYREFEEFVFNNYDLRSFGINIKYYHSRRVAVLSKRIAENLRLSLYDINKATTIGLLHDIARFYEYRMFKDFNNVNGFDHGKWGVKVLNSHNYYEKFNIHKEDLKDIYPAIYYHNKLKLPYKYKNNVFCKIIRDADKIDIFNVVKNVVKIKEDDIINDKLLNDFFKGKLSSWKLKTNGSNEVIFFLSFVYDLNYDYSCKFLLESGYLDNLYDSLDYKERFNVYFDYAKEYLVRRAKNVRE